jgi:membrane-associated phospholipid phosphatase
LATSVVLVALVHGQDVESLDPPQSQPQTAPQAETNPSSANPIGPRTFVHDFGRDEWRIWTSPFRKSSYGSRTVRKYVIPFMLLSGALIATDKETAKVLPNTPDQAKWSGRASQFGAAYSLAGISGGAYLLGKVTGNEHAQESGWLALEALAHTQVVVFAVKQLTNRRRPLPNRSHGGFWDGGDSFPSGHAASSFTVATVFAYEYHDHRIVPIAAYALASLVSISRVSAQRHWVSDIVVGGSTGFLIGRFVYKQHHNPSLPGSPVRRALPRVAFSTRGINMAWEF